MSIPNNLTPDQLTEQVSDIVREIIDHGFMSSVVQLESRNMVVIATQGDGTDQNPIVPLFFLPSPEIMLSLIDPATGDPIFKLASAN